MSREQQHKLDEMTGILSREAAEQLISERMQQGGAIFIAELANLKQINNRYGHILGDDSMRQTAALLSFLIRTNGILGRHGGDEFVIYLHSCADDEKAAAFCETVMTRFRSFNDRLTTGIRLNISIVGVPVQADDSFESAVERAERQLTREKTDARRNYDAEQRKDDWMRDMKQIKKELAEEIHQKGAYCQDYETFKSIYRFVERCMERNQQKACIILLSLVDVEGRNLKPPDKEVQMQLLGDAVRSTLRMGDVYTRYSSCQYLILAINASVDTTEIIANRIWSSFSPQNDGQTVLVHYSYELHSPKVLSQPWEQDGDLGFEIPGSGE